MLRQVIKYPAERARGAAGADLERAAADDGRAGVAARARERERGRAVHREARRAAFRDRAEPDIFDRHVVHIRHGPREKTLAGGRAWRAMRGER